jgi:hypothetical protein
MSFAPTMDGYEQRQREMQEAAADAERGRKQNVEVLTRLWLCLGPDVMKFVGTAHDAELAEARGLASSRWFRLLDLEQQVIRDEAALTSRPKTRPAELGDSQLPDRTLRQFGAAYQDETKSRIAQLADLREQAKNERRSLESLRIDFTKGR